MKMRLNNHGFARIYSVVPAIRAERPRFRWIRPEHIAALGETDPRGRYEVRNGEEIRASGSAESCFMKDFFKFVNRIFV